MNSCVCFIIVSLWTLTYASEPECPRFYYEEKTLEKIVKTEFVVEKLKSQLEENDGTTKAEMEKIRRDLDRIESDLIALKERHEESKVSEDFEKMKDNEETSVVVFKASQIEHLNPSIGDTIIFTSTHFDKGNGYDNTTGIYTAPTSGIYIFTCQLCVKKDENVQVDFVQGTATVNTLFTDGGKMAGACRKMVNVSILDANEQVRMKVLYKSRDSVFWQNSSGKNIFSGVLITDIL